MLGQRKMTKTLAIAITLLAVIAVCFGIKVLFGQKKADEPLISLVLLLNAPRQMSVEELRNRASEAFGMTFETDNPDATQFAIEVPVPPKMGVPNGAAKCFIVKADQGVFLVNNFAIPYMENPAAFSGGIHDKRLSNAISSHRAWISVDAIGNVVDENSKVEAYRIIGKMIAGLARPDCLAIYCPELQRCNEYDQVLQEKLRSNDPLSLFQEPTFVPVINVDGEDPRMIRAVAEARKRWPEFVSAFQSDLAKDKPFIIKAEFKEGDKSEFMWVSVKTIEANRIYGVLENSPLELKNVKEGQEVAVQLSSLNDWLYSKDGESVGGFTLQIITDAEKR
jgi:uncharacterized protein YegJ (DUF2314 family)